MPSIDFAIIVPMANEAPDFVPFTNALKNLLDKLGYGTVYLITDNASKDNTSELCRTLSEKDPRFRFQFEPNNKNVVDAYMAGYRIAYAAGHSIIIEMDAGLSHDPQAVPLFLKALTEGNDCAFGSRFIEGGSMKESDFKRVFLSRSGTFLSNLLLGSKLSDMTSGYQGFHAPVVKQLLDYQLRSKAHFYQTEVRYLLRKKRQVEIPIHYKAPSPRVSQGAIVNSLQVLLYYFLKRITFSAKSLN